jgi:hypothetical protein
VEACLEDSASLMELAWKDQDLLNGIATFSKVSLLHRYIYAMIAVEHRYEYRKNADLYEEGPDLIQAIEQMLQAYKVPFLPFKEFSPPIPVDNANTRAEYPFHQWFLSQEESFGVLWEKQTDEAFHLLFANRAFLLRFNQTVAESIRNRRVTIPGEYLEHTGYIRRAHLPVWIRDAVYFRDHGRCVLCHVDLSGLLSTDRVDQFDHMVALGAYGINDPCNIQLLCEACNLRKGDRRSMTGIGYFRGGRNRVGMCIGRRTRAAPDGGGGHAGFRRVTPRGMPQVSCVIRWQTNTGADS